MRRQTRRWLGPVVALVVVAVIELLALAAGALLGGADFHPEARASRARLAGDSSLADVIDASQRTIEVPNRIANLVIHPYLGYVTDPVLNEDPERQRRGDLVVNPQGFFRRPREPARRNGEALRIAVFGGSVALLFAFEGDRSLAGALEEMLSRPVVVDNYAVGGFKQPQQLMALNYLLAIGEQFDVVINIDGFNEVALTSIDNRQRGVYAHYPRSWDALAGTLTDVRETQLVGALSFGRARRRSLARAFSVPLVDLSPTATLVWRLMDSRSAQHLSGLEAELEARTVSRAEGKRRFLTHGPPDGTGVTDRLFGEIADVWHRSSLQMHAICSSRDIAYVHVLQPNQYVEGAKKMSASERRRAYREESTYRSSVERGYPHLQEAGKHLVGAGVSFHDLSRFFAEVEEPLFTDDCCHFNSRGSQLVATYLAEVIHDLVAAERASRP